MLAAEKFGDLHGIESSAFAQVIRNAPNIEAVLNRRIFAHAADIGGILADSLDRRHIAAVLAFIDEQHAGRLPKFRLRLFGGDLTFALDVPRF